MANPLLQLRKMSCFTIPATAINFRPYLLDPQFEPTIGRVHKLYGRNVRSRHRWEIDSFLKRYYRLNRIFSPAFWFAEIEWHMIIRTKCFFNSGREFLNITLWGKTTNDEIILYRRRRHFKYKILFFDKYGDTHMELDGEGEFFGKYVSLGKHNIDVTDTLLNDNMSERESIFVHVLMTKRRENTTY